MMGVYNIAIMKPRTPAWTAAPVSGVSTTSDLKVRTTTGVVQAFRPAVGALPDAVS